MVQIGQPHSCKEGADPNPGLCWSLICGKSPPPWLWFPPSRTLHRAGKTNCLVCTNSKYLSNGVLGIISFLFKSGWFL